MDAIRSDPSPQTMQANDGGLPLTAGQARLLDTVVTSSALLPDIQALRDVHHPCVALYNTRWNPAFFFSPRRRCGRTKKKIPVADRAWTEKDHGGIHLGAFTATILTEFCATTGPGFCGVFFF